MGTPTTSGSQAQPARRGRRLSTVTTCVLLVGLSALTTACQPEDTAGADGTTGGATDTAIAPNTQGQVPRGSVPREVVGSWITGDGAGTYVDENGRTVFRSGAGVAFTFTPNGTFTQETLVNTAPYIKGAFYHDEGPVATQGNVLVLNATQRWGMERAAGQSDWARGPQSARPATTSYTWRLKSSYGRNDLCLTPLDNSTGEACYGNLAAPS